jgi:hypothetical protein
MSLPMVNDRGEYVSCAATSFGIVGSIVAQTRYNNCAADAKEKGYQVQSEQK